MIVNILFEVQSKPDAIKKLKSNLKRILPHAGDHDGCMSVQLIENQDDPNNLIVMELWKSRKHFEAYNERRIEKARAGKLRELLVESPSLRFYRNIDS